RLRCRRARLPFPPPAPCGPRRPDGSPFQTAGVSIASSLPETGSTLVPRTSRRCEQARPRDVETPLSRAWGHRPRAPHRPSRRECRRGRHAFQESPMSLTIAVIVGSLRQDSFNARLADALARLAPDDIEFRRLRIDDLPLYNQDDDDSPPAPVTRMKE